MASSAASFAAFCAALFAPVSAAFARLNPREQLFAILGSIATVVLVFTIAALLVSSSLAKGERKINSWTGQLEELISLKSSYKALEKKNREQLEALKSSRLSLVSFVEDLAKRAEVKVGRLNASEGQEAAGGIVETRVDLRATGLSADKLQEFLNLIENSPQTVFIRRLQIVRPYKKDMVDVEMTIVSFKSRS